MEGYIEVWSPPSHAHSAVLLLFGVDLYHRARKQTSIRMAFAFISKHTEDESIVQRFVACVE